MAHGTFSKSNGIVVDIENDKKGQQLFEALLWSDYHEESEYFFIGGLQHFNFLTIHDLAKKRDYKSYIGPMTMLQQMIRGYSFNQRAITKFDGKILYRLITDNLSNSVTAKIPVYIRRLFANFTNNVQRVEINILNKDHGKWNESQCGYLEFESIFFADCGTNNECIRLPLFLRLFDRSLESIVILNVFRAPTFDKSIHLNPALASSLLSGCKMITSNPRLNGRFQSIIILNPKDSISGFIAKHQSDFKAIGWRLEENEHNHPRRGRCPEGLHLSPL